MENFSKIELEINKFRDTEQQRIKFFTSQLFTAKERTKEASEERIKKSKADFFYFDKTYYTSDMYSDGYFKPNRMLKDIVKYGQQKGVQIFLGSRKHGKTVTAKKFLCWLLLTGRIKLAGVYCETLPKAENLLDDIAQLILQNERICYDYQAQKLELNADQFEFVIKPVKGIITVASFSEGRSLRGYTRRFDRPEFVLGDDVETYQSSFSDSAVTLRINKLNEAYSSLTDGTFMIMGNDLDERCALHSLRLEQENGVIAPNWFVRVYPAFENGKPLWHERFGKISESELKLKLGALNEADWQTNYQMNPIADDGFVFSRDGLKTTYDIPADAKGIIYCDPNLSKKGKGDSTAIVSLLYSAKEQKYFIDEIVCKSYSDSNRLLDDLLKMKNRNHNAVGFDGNVSQESTWSMHIRNYCFMKQIPYPYITYCRYRVDDLSKNVQGAWNDGKILINHKITESKEGVRFLQQLFSFTGKKSNKADDGADALICAFELIHERRMVKQKAGSFKTTVIKEGVF